MKPNAMKTRVSFAILAVFFVLGGCTDKDDTKALPSVPKPDYWPDTKWKETSPEAQGIPSSNLADMLENINRNDLPIDSVHVIRNGYQVLEAYRHPFGPGMQHILHSCTKSIVSCLIGIAIDEGAIEGTNVSVASLFRGRTATTRYKEELKLKHLLTMTTGLRSQDSSAYRWAGLKQMAASADWVQYALDLPPAGEPGFRFDYSNIASFLLSAIVQEKTGVKAADYARDKLFGPLGIHDFSWAENPQGVTIGYAGLRMQPHDLAKIGLLFLREGLWRDERIVSKKWVEESTLPHIEVEALQKYYGYQWWVVPDNIFMAIGHGGQYLIASREYNLVVVFTSTLPEPGYTTCDTNLPIPNDLFQTFILPNLSVGRLERDQAGEERLRRAVKLLATPPP